MGEGARWGRRASESEVINVGRAKAAGSGFRSRPDLAFANYQVPSTLCNPSTHFSKLRDTGHISAAFLPAPAGGPSRGVCEAWPRRPAPIRQREARRLRRGRQPRGPRALVCCEPERLAWRSRTCILLSCHLGESFRVPHLKSSLLDMEVEVETFHTGMPLGYCGAGRSCPFSTYC